MIKSENDEIFRRLEKIEEILDTDDKDMDKVESRNAVEEIKDHSQLEVKTKNNSRMENTRTPKPKVKRTSRVKTVKEKKEIVEDNEDTNKGEESEEDLEAPTYGEVTLDINAALRKSDDNVEETGLVVDDGERHNVEMKVVPEKMFEGYCFRPLTGWKNSGGCYEITKEIIQFTHTKVAQRLDKPLIVITSHVRFN